MRGGARPNSGPLPDPNALRRDRPSDKHRDRLGVEHLPGEGSTAPAPPWPLPTAPDELEQRVWEQEWRRPQAVMWHQTNVSTEVALYVRALIAGEGSNATVVNRRLVASYMDSLGISLKGLHFHRWQIDEPVAVLAARKAAAVPDEPATTRRRTPRGSSTRARLGVLRGGKG